MKFEKFKDIIYLFKEAFLELKKANPLLMAGATSFFTLFAMPPALTILVSLFGIIFREEYISGEMKDTLEQAFGERSAGQVIRILENIKAMGDNIWITIFGAIFLMFVATTLFVVVQNSLNLLWKVRQKPGKPVLRILKNRLKSLLVILFTGFLFFISFLLETILIILRNQLKDFLPDFLIPAGLLSQLITIALVTVWFAVLFKYLSYIKISWRPVWAGAVFTALLFTAGKYLLGNVLLQSNIGNIYGAAASVVLILLFIFYFSFIIFYGASFTMVFSRSKGFKAVPHKYASIFEIKDKNDNTSD